MEDKFLAAEHAKVVCVQLEESGLGHVLALHKTDSSWHEQYRPHRPELAAWMWSIRLKDSLLPMPQIQKLIAICEANSLTFWLGGHEEGDEGYGAQLYVKIERTVASG